MLIIFETIELVVYFYYTSYRHLCVIQAELYLLCCMTIGLVIILLGDFLSEDTVLFFKF